MEFKLSPQPLSSLSPRLLGVQGRRWGPPRAAAQSQENRGGLPPWPAAKGTAAEPPAAPDGATGLASWKRLGGGWPAAARAPRVVGRLRHNPPGGLGDLPVALLSLMQGWSFGGSNRRQKRLSLGSRLVCFFFLRGSSAFWQGPRYLVALVATLSRQQCSLDVPRAAQKATRVMGQALESRTCGVAVQSYVCLCFLRH